MTIKKRLRVDTYLEPPPVFPNPEALAAQAADSYPFGHSSTAQTSLGPNCFKALGSPGEEELNVPEKRSHPRGRPLQPRFPKEPYHRASLQGRGRLTSG